MTTESGSDKPSILLCTAVRGGFAPSYKRSVRALEAWCLGQGIPFDTREVAEAPIEVARDLLAAAFLVTQHTHCLMIDSGDGIGVETIEKMLAVNEDFVAAAVPLRQTRLEKVAERGQARYGAAFAVEFDREARETGKISLVNKGGAACAAVDIIGAACMCLRRDVFLRMFDAYPELGHKDGFEYFAPTAFDSSGLSRVSRLKLALEELRAEDNRHARERTVADAFVMAPEEFTRCGEDVSFCRRWRKLDSSDQPAKIWLVADAPFMHEGHGFFAGNFADTLD
jgi:hypothetical protein